MTRRLGSGSRRTAWAALLLALPPLACNGAGKGGSRSAQTHASARVGGAVISTVDGQPITVSDVQDLVNGSDLQPDEALRRLQAERLLMIEAERLEFGESSAVDHVARQAGVQTLLESATRDASVSDDDIRAAYDAAKARFERPEVRVAVHVLAALPRQAAPEADAAARAYAEGMIEPLAQAEDVRALLKSVRNQQMQHFGVSAEALPPMTRTSNLVPAFLEAMFGLPAPGVVPKPIKTVYGWHAIRVLQVHPAVSTPYAEAAEQLRAELIATRKKQIVEELIAGARKRHRVEMSGSLRETLAKLEL